MVKILSKYCLSPAALVSSTCIPPVCLRKSALLACVSLCRLQKRKYLQGKRGFLKPPFRLPDYIEATGITKIREAQLDSIGDKSMRQKQRDRMRPKRGKIAIDYQVMSLCLSVSLSLTHTHTHSVNLPVCLSVCVSLSLSLYLFFVFLFCFCVFRCYMMHFSVIKLNRISVDLVICILRVKNLR